MLRELAGMPGVEVAMPPDGTLCVLPEVSAYCDGDDTKWCLELLREKRLALVPGAKYCGS